MIGQIRNWVLSIQGEAAQFEGMRFVRAMSIAPGLIPGDFDREIILKVSEAGWQLIKQTPNPVKVLQAKLVNCQDDAVVISQNNVCSPEIMQIAEFFTGKFRGWAQGAFIMHRMGIPASVSWGLERDASCFRTQDYMMGKQTVVCNVEELHEAACDNNAEILVQADVMSNWWTRMFLYAPINARTVSAPCQPLSTAARQSGLQSDSGKVVTRVADVAAEFLPTVVMLEQVSGFASHRDFGCVMGILEAAGYEVCWKSTYWNSNRSCHVTATAYSWY